ncbi:tyrosine kinase receptor Cad96Ca [Wyeomyia smithii]|uniref:tyrosine kinase receptor Cad96Ca n=1 Tax=Wyeomyia smithii TaxID=174621 RepID=UPI002467FD67|nr:tyrosine kinase receptor Cad96Ca [Wyeomyia smithii]XP_055532789.1 tyrosine kinase receptor Cad96Ca [Wyeomyia smithii]XP_055532790.1 tyrosine kinase receptor Cad96Ca [Wyeomyia smithii]XP_055532791.1 tyrosine kinase receptor Cad96Ca [Wyeomyia smithii]XP_055532792.1 tyrosine kinase receptor Cad96Ca [Wyeomyia smithii]
MTPSCVDYAFATENRHWISMFFWIGLMLAPVAESQELNTPPVVVVDRNWLIRENTTVGTMIKQVVAEDSDNDELEFGLDPLGNGMLQPFVIDPQTGYVYLNESLEGKAGQNFFFYVTVTDGLVTSKNEVYVNILNKNATNVYNTRAFTPDVNHLRRILPPGLHLPGISSIPQAPPPPPPFPPKPTQPFDSNQQQPSLSSTTKQTKTYPDRSDSTTEASSAVSGNGTVTKLAPVSTDGATGPSSSIPPVSHSTTTGTRVSSSTVNPIRGKPTSSGTDGHQLTSVVSVIISVVAIFLTAGLIAVCIFRKYLCAISKTLKKKNKIDKAKKSNQSNLSSNITSSTTAEDSRNSIGMNHWSGPMAFSNRYISPWDRDQNGHLQVTSQLSSASSNNSGMNGCLKDRWEFPRHRLKVFNILGEGAFGQVWRCEATDIDGKEGISTTAVKTLKENASEAERNDLLSELQVLKSLEPHINVVRLLGCCTEKDPIFVILEYVNMGKLQTFLRNSRVEKHYGNTHGKSKILTSGDLTSFMYQVARGMDFLTSRGIIHRDLAARNILITEDHTCKVADFGFARDIVTSKVYERKSEGRLPIRWMATESLYDNIFTVKSDIWSFGILMWEIVTLGSTPYPGIAAADVMRKVRDGYRLEKPEHCRRELYNIMFYCWAKDPNERPDFPEVVEMLDRLLQTETDYIELERFPDHNYYNMLNMSGEKL